MNAVLLLALITMASASKLTSGPVGLHPDMMVSDEVHDVPNPLQGVVEELTKNITELTKAYETLCQEIFHLSSHVVFHEHALRHIAQAGHRHGAHHHQDNSHTDHDHHHDHDHHNHTDAENEISTSPTDQPHEVNSSDHDHKSSSNHHQLEDHHHDHHHEEHQETSDPIKGCVLSNGKGKCSALQEQQCHDDSKPFKEQFELWFRNLLNDAHANETNHHGVNGTENSSRHHHHHHHTNDETPIGAHDHVAKRENRFMDDMEESVREPEMMYATCEIVPNRHISLILQENVEGRINLWQQKDGQGPLFTHIKVSGLRVPGEFKSRVARESNLMPVETPLNTTSHPHTIVSFERGFHVHVNGDLTRDCQSTGTHYNPTESAHGGPLDTVRHIGDLGNIRCDERGNVDAEYAYPKVSLVGEHSIIGRSLVIHAQADDLGRNQDESSVTSGNSGAKIACCIIEEIQQLPILPDSPSNIGAIQGVSKDSSTVERESENN